MAKKLSRAHFIPPGWHAVTPRIFAHDAKQLVKFVKRVFNAAGKYNEDAPSQIKIGDSIVMITEAGIRKANAVCLYVYVKSADAAYRRAVAAGAKIMEKPQVMPYGDRRCIVEDKWGNTWQIATYRGPRNHN